MKIFLCALVCVLVALSVEAAKFKIPLKRRESGLERKMKNLKGMKMVDLMRGKMINFNSYPEPLKNDKNIGDLEIKGQTFGEALIEDAILSDINDPTDGILGLGLPKLSNYALPPFFRAMKQGLFEKNIFSVYLNKYNKNGSNIIFGDWDDDLIDANTINWVPLTSDMYWQFNMDSINVGRDMSVETNAAAIADTGTSLILGPQEGIESIMATLGATYNKYIGYYIVDASQVASLPDIVFKINGQDYTLKPSDYTISASGNEFAIIGIVNDPRLDSWILGDVFLNKFYSIYNVDNNTVGFAPLKGTS